MEIFSKKLNNIQFSDIKRLAHDQIPETYDLDYKEDYPEGNTLPKLMIALSNSTGGYIIMGVKCEEGTNIPTEICGVDQGEHTSRITSMAYANSQPRIWPKVHVIPHESKDNKDVVVIKVEESYEPVMFMQGNKFPIRINDKVEYADQSLVKKLFSKKNILERIHETLDEIHFNHKRDFLKKISNDPGNRYITINFTSIPFYKGGQIINLNSIKEEKFINSLRSKISYKLFENLSYFGDFLRNFNYMGNYFQSKFEKSTKESMIFSDFRIYSNGMISCTITYLARKGQELDGIVQGMYDETIVDQTTAYHSAYLYYKNVPALVILLLYLCKITYDQRFIGKILTSIRFLTRDYKILMGTKFNYVFSNKNDFNIDKSFYTRNLDDKDKFQTVVKEILKNFLRYFGYDLNYLERALERFNDTITLYLDSIFN